MATAPQRLVPPPSDEQVDLFDYSLVRHYLGFLLRAPRRHKMLFSMTFLSVVVLAVVGLLVFPKRYQVQGSVLVQRSPVMGSLSNPNMNRDWDAPTRAARELVLRRENLISLSKQTDLVRQYRATAAPVVRFRDWLLTSVAGQRRTDDMLLEDLVDALAERLWVGVGNEGTVTITFQWSNPDIGYRMVGAAMESFLEARHTLEISMVSETVAILESHAARIQNQILEMVPQLEEKERRLRVATRTPQPSPARPRVARDENLVRAESTLAARQRTLSDLEEFRQRRLEELQGQLAQQLTTYAPQHPAVLSIRQNIQTLSLPSPQMESLKSEIQDLEREVTRRGGLVSNEPDAAAAMRNELAELRLRSLEDDPRVEYERGQLRLLFRQYSTITDRLDTARVELDTARAAFKHRYSVLAPPQMPKGPIRPKTPLVLAGSIVGGLVLAFLVSATADLRSGRVVEGWQVEQSLKLRVIADIRE